MTVKIKKQFLTEILALDPYDLDDDTSKHIKTWGGPTIWAYSFNEAVEYCKNHLGYCKVIGELIGTVEWNSEEFKEAEQQISEEPDSTEDFNNQRN